MQVASLTLQQGGLSNSADSAQLVLSQAPFFGSFRPVAAPAHWDAMGVCLV